MFCIVLYCFMMFYLMFYAGILYQQHSDSVQIVFSPFFTVGTCWNQARRWTNLEASYLVLPQVATLKAELETWRAECGRLSQAGQAQINDRALGALVHIVTLFGSFGPL